VALLADLLSLPGSERRPLQDVSPQRKKERTLEALIRELEGLTRRQPVLMIFEDAHWIVTCGWPVQGGWNSGRNVTISSIGRLRSRSTVRSRSSREAIASTGATAPLWSSKSPAARHCRMR
jgi:hypothetical protein